MLDLIHKTAFTGVGFGLAPRTEIDTISRNLLSKGEISEKERSELLNFHSILNNYLNTNSLEERQS